MDFEPVLNEDSDVIELTEEVGEEEGVFDIFDDLDMPEFRLPAEKPASAPASAADAAPGAAIIGRKVRTRQPTPALETLKLDQSEIERRLSETVQQRAAAPAEAAPAQSAPAQPALAQPAPAQSAPAQSEPAPAPDPFMTETSLDMSSLAEDSHEELETVVLTKEVRSNPVPAPAEPVAAAAAEPAAPQAPEREELPTMQMPSVSRAPQPEPEPAVEPPRAEPEPEPIAEPELPEGLVDESEALELEPVVEPEPEPELEPEPTPEQPEASGDGYDRQELVRTIQMQAVDRSQLDLSLESERLANAELLEDQQFAPDILVAAPRVLTRRWSEGAPALPRPTPPARPKETASKPPPRPTQPTPARPQAAVAQNQPPTQQPAAQQPAAGPGRRPAVSAQQPAVSKPAAQQVGDPEMSGLVQELLDEAHAPPKPQPKPKQPQRQLTPRDTWFRDVFTEEFLRTVPRNIDTTTERDARFINRALSLQKESRILDLACGYGRHAIALAPRGYEIVGLDLSMTLLQRALSDAQRRNLLIKFVHGDMRSMNFNEIFDGAYLWQTSFGYFDDVTNFKVLQGVARALKQGGRFVMDVVNRDYVIAEVPGRCWWEGHECIFLEEFDFDFTASVLHTKRSFIYEDGSPPLEQNSYVRLYGLHELLQLFKSAGLRVLDVSGEVHQNARFLGPASSRIIITAEKAAKG